MTLQNLQHYYFWVLAPSVASADDNINYYYDFTQSIAEYKEVFAELNAEWKWQPVTIKNYPEVIETIAESANGKIPFVINLCDGDDVNEVPGVAVIHELEKKGLLFTGASAYFYTITTSKIPMKMAFDACGVPNAPWVVLKDDLTRVFEQLKAPVIIKPAVSGGSMGVSVQNVVHDFDALQKRVTALENGYHGWNLMVDGLIAEEFITGKEYTTFIIGNYLHPENCVVYVPVQRVFHPSLPKEEQFLSFDRLWEIYEEETAMPGEENFYEYEAVTDSSLTDRLTKLSIAAYVSCKGVGYARIDFREAEKTGAIFCLEVNAQCGLSEDENFTSIGAILRFSQKSFSSVITGILNEALQRNSELVLQKNDR